MPRHSRGQAFAGASPFGWASFGAWRRSEQLLHRLGASWRRLCLVQMSPGRTVQHRVLQRSCFSSSASLLVSRSNPAVVLVLAHRLVEWLGADLQLPGCIGDGAALWRTDTAVVSTAHVRAVSTDFW